MGSRARCWRARSATSRGSACEQPHAARGAGAAGVAAGHGRRACASWRRSADAQLDRVLELVDGGHARRAAAATRRGCATEFAAFEQAAAADAHARARRLPHRPDPALARTGCGWSTSRASRPSPWPSATALGTPLRDVAAMLRSFDHLARYVDRDVMPGHPRRIEALDRRRAGGLPRGLRRPRSAGCCARSRSRRRRYEFVYAATFLPEWTYAAMGGHALADGGAGAVNSEGFQADILAEPEALERVARRLRRPAAWSGCSTGRRVLLIGMGSSGYAAGHGGRAAAQPRPRRSRRAGVDRHAAAGRPADTLAVRDLGLGRIRRDDRGAAPAQRRQPRGRDHEHARRACSPPRRTSPLDVLAGPEEGGIACRSFACTQAVLALMCGAPADEHPDARPPRSAQA